MPAPDAALTGDALLARVYTDVEKTMIEQGSVSLTVSPPITPS